MTSALHPQSSIPTCYEALTLLQYTDQFFNYLTVKSIYGKTQLLSQA
ncbi:MAG: hypothetical protein HYR68_07040 [Burkholderiales bacterium]|nr:hypothetical protein [Burkholderiales bacterium]MBI3729803.1 hypothetical protein [Burkholderiales bacterium]